MEVAFWLEVDQEWGVALDAKPVQAAQAVKLMFLNVDYKPNVYKTGAIVPIAILFSARPYIFSRYI